MAIVLASRYGPRMEVAALVVAVVAAVFAGWAGWNAHLSAAAARDSARSSAELAHLEQARRFDEISRSIRVAVEEGAHETRVLFRYDGWRPFKEARLRVLPGEGGQVPPLFVGGTRHEDNLYDLNRYGWADASRRAQGSVHHDDWPDGGSIDLSFELEMDGQRWQVPHEVMISRGPRVW